MIRFVLAFTLIGIPSLLGVFGFHQWPFSTFPMYTHKIENPVSIEVWITFSDETEFRLSDSRVLWPVGAVWLNYYLGLIINNRNIDDKLNKIFPYYCGRVQKLKHLKYLKKSNKTFELSLRRLSTSGNNEQTTREILKRYVCNK